MKRTLGSGDGRHGGANDGAVGDHSVVDNRSASVVLALNDLAVIASVRVGCSAVRAAGIRRVNGRR